MFASKITKPQMKIDETDNLARLRSTSTGRPFGGTAVEQALMLQQTIGNRAMLRLIAQRAQNLTGISSDAVSKVARNLGHDLPRVPSPVRLDAAPLKEREANADSSMRMTTAFAGSPPTFTNLGFALFCQSPEFALTGQLSVPPAQANGDLTLGFMQAVVGCTGPTGHYYDDNNQPYMSAFQPYKSLPLRDGEPDGIFYGPEAQHDVNSPTVPVKMQDRPQASLLWTTPDKKGTLQQVVGEEKYITWLVTKSDSTTRIEPLRYITWSVDWFAGVDQSEKLGTPFGVGRITAVGEGQGPMAPIRSGPTANSSKGPVEWKPWS
jgi:hypothetical protein